MFLAHEFFVRLLDMLGAPLEARLCLFDGLSSRTSRERKLLGLSL
jgi:hypothetical protein